MQNEHCLHENHRNSFNRHLHHLSFTINLFILLMNYKNI